MANDELRCHQIRVRDGRVEELRDTAAVVSLPLSDVRRMRIAVGMVAERPIVQAALGLALTALGLACLSRFLHWVAAGGTIWEVTVLMIGWAAGGPAILLGALRRGLVLHVDMERTSRRLSFGRKATLDETRVLAQQLQARGVPVDVTSS